MKRLAALYGGSFPEHRVLNNPVRRKWISDVIYLLDLPNTDLNQFGGLLIPEGLHYQRLVAASDQIQRFLHDGGATFVFGDQPVPWLPGLDWEFRTARPPKDDELVVHQPDHRFHQRLSFDDMLHFHGLYHPPVGAETLLATADGAGALVYLDWDSTRGTLLATSLDLMVHAGTTGHPTSERFLDHFLPWVVEDLL
jgi:hypothetical protein